MKSRCRSAGRVGWVLHRLFTCVGHAPSLSLIVGKGLKRDGLLIECLVFGGEHALIATLKLPVA
jgi:hypothetical protein